MCLPLATVKLATVVGMEKGMSVSARSTSNSPCPQQTARSSIMIAKCKSADRSIRKATYKNLYSLFTKPLDFVSLPFSATSTFLLRLVRATAYACGWPRTNNFEPAFLLFLPCNVLSHAWQVHRNFICPARPGAGMIYTTVIRDGKLYTRSTWASS